MKKKIIASILLVMMIIPLTGCGDNAIIKSINKLQKEKGYTSNVTVNIEYQQDDKREAKFEVINDNKNMLSYTNAIYKLNEEDKITHDFYYNSKSQESYHLGKTVAQNMGVNEPEQYKKDSFLYIFDLNTYKKLLKNAKVEKTTDGYKATINSQEFNKVLNNQLFITADRTYLNDVKNQKITYNVSIKDGMISKINVDLSDYIKAATKNVGNDISIINGLKYTIEISDKTYKEVKLPKETNKSLDAKQERAKEDALIYISFINTENLKSKSYKDTKEYGNIKPEKVNLKISKGLVKSGTITIDGYKFTYKDGKIEEDK